MTKITGFLAVKERKAKYLPVLIRYFRVTYFRPMKTKLPFFRGSMLVITLGVSLVLLLSAGGSVPVQQKHCSANVPGQDIYQQLHLSELGLNKQAFDLAMKGLEKLKATGVVTKDILSICDFSQSSNNKRLYIIDVDSRKLLINSLVAHGKNTGDEFARYFSNDPSSYKSSLGFYTTKQTYVGEHGLSLKLSGREPGFNDKAEERSIVLHGADYVCDNFICTAGRLGRSFGCPSVPVELRDKIINTIKDGTCLFIFYPDKKYLASSELLN